LGRQQAEVKKENLRMSLLAEEDNPKSGAENVRGLNLAAVKLTTVQVTKLLLLHYTYKIGLTEDLYFV
jgi:hypothetical protein